MGCLRQTRALATVVVGVIIVSSLLNFSFTLTRLNIAHRHYMKGQVALGGFEVIRVSELGDQIEYSDTAPLMLAGKVLARTNNYYPNYHSRSVAKKQGRDDDLRR